jgi:hypothetical protein
MIADPYSLDPIIVGRELLPEGLYLEPGSGSDRWFRAAYARGLAFSASIFSVVSPGRDRDPLIDRLDRNGVPTVNTFLESNCVPNVPNAGPNSVPKGPNLGENLGEFSPIISCRNEADLEENIVPGGRPAPPKMLGRAPQVDNNASLREITFSGLCELRAEDPIWGVVSELGPGVGVGNWRAPKLVVVGGEPTDSGEGIYPFYSRAGCRLLESLRSLGWDECDIFLCNSIGPDGSRHRKELRALYDAFAPHEPVWISLGQVAERVTRSLRKDVGGLICEHPAWHMKSRCKETFRDYARLLQKGGLPAGESFDLGVHRVSEEDLDSEVPFNLGDVFDLPPSIWVKPEAPTPSGSIRKHITKAKSDVARVAFVTGAAPNLKESSKIAKCDYNHLLLIAKKEDWRGERDRHQDSVREKALEISLDRESREISKVRTTAWSAAVKAVDIVNRRLESGKYVPNAMDAARLVSMAMDLTTASDVGADHDRERVRNRTIAQIGKDLVQTLQSQFGKDVIDVKAVVRSKPDEST